MHLWALCNRVFPRISLTLPFRLYSSRSVLVTISLRFICFPVMYYCRQFQSSTYLGGARQHGDRAHDLLRMLAVSEI